ncbi:enoyl-CoA hydratase/isomerase family protein [Xanthocytophaga flava]|uniref:enoyl-CoA hydratase/isomerase family protein n=1 Tax=Xanthocytophaga flava TaxID=3048013 RepID=UPI0028D2BE93|nr:enoyl-CoA hydratase-related protein [Xanthocytophaga flavus]MDJ1469176.1 enoyl-CoA hydratase-related protein [Xanthocytophaga flavus]
MSWTEYAVMNRIALVTLNRPEKRNALNHIVVKELTELLTKAVEDQNVKVIILQANGPVFCAGADLEYLQQLQTNTYEENLEDSRQLAQLFELIYTMPKVVIARIQGHAIAGGCGLATVCDFSFSVPEAKFGYTEVKIGFIPAIVSYFLANKIGDGKARELLLSGNLIPASQAQEYGLINFVTEPDVLDSEIMGLAEQLCQQNSAQSMAWTKKLLADIRQKTLADAMVYAAEANAHARASEDCQKGIAAFLDKKDLTW